jgi:hypothetical protein
MPLSPTAEFVSGTRGLALEATSALDPTRPGYVVVPGASGPVDGDPDAGDETVPVLLSRIANSAAMPLIKHLDFDVIAESGRLNGHSRAGRLPRTQVTGQRRPA